MHHILVIFFRNNAVGQTIIVQIFRVEIGDFGITVALRRHMLKDSVSDHLAYVGIIALIAAAAAELIVGHALCEGCVKIVCMVFLF